VKQVISVRRHLSSLLARVMLLALLSTLVLAGRAWAQASPAQEPAVPLDHYVGSLREAQQLLSGSADPDDALARARAVLAAIERVELPSGAEIAVSPLLGVGDDELTRIAAQARIVTLLAQLAAAEGDDTAARLAVLQTVLAGPAFRQGESWWDTVRRWLAEWLERLLPDATPASPGTGAMDRAADAVTWAAGIAALIAIMLLLAYWLRGLIAGFVADEEMRDRGRDGDDLPQTPAEARRRAAGLAGAGDYRSAVRNLYLSALLTLEQHGLVPDDRSLTNRELLARVGSAHPLRPHLQPVVETFDDVWYGVHEPDAATYDAYTHSIDELESLAQQAGKEPNR
jgi:hypothetical protein